MEDKVRLTRERLAKLVAGKILISDPSVGAKLLNLDAGKVPDPADTTAIHTFADEHRGTLGRQLEKLFATPLRDESIRTELDRLCKSGCTGDEIDLFISSIIGFHAATMPEDQQDFGPALSALVETGEYSGKLTTARIGFAVDSLNDLGLFTPDSAPEEIATGVIATMSFICRLADQTES